VAAPLAEEVTARYVSSDPDVIRLLGRCVKSGVAATVGQDLAYLAIEFMTTEYGERGRMHKSVMIWAFLTIGNKMNVQFQRGIRFVSMFLVGTGHRD